MKNKDKISDLFIAINYINSANFYQSKNKKESWNIRQVWDVLLNPNKYEKERNKLFEDKTFTKIFYKILETEKILYQPKSIAAASGKIFERVSKDFEIEIIESNKDEKSAYLLLTLFMEIKPIFNFYVVCKDQFSTHKIPALNNQKAQILLQKDDKFYSLITSPDAEIFIR